MNDGFDEREDGAWGDDEWEDEQWEDEELEDEDSEDEEWDDEEWEDDEPEADVLDLDDDLDMELTEIAAVVCPYCGEKGEIAVDPVGGDVQEYVEDCEVCCQPWSIRVTLDAEGGVAVEVDTLDAG